MMARTLANRVPAPPACVVLYSPRDRARAMVRAAFPRRHGRIVTVRTAGECSDVFRSMLVDAAVVDISAPGEETWRIAELAREFPSAPFFGLSPLRAGDGPAVGRCVSLDFADVLVEGVDDPVARALIAPHAFSARFAESLRDPPPSLALSTDIQLRTWRWVVAFPGRALRTDALAKAVGVTREHLSRSFAAFGAPNLKRVIDLVRLVAAAELSKNPGYDTRDVARVLGFASSSHLSSTAQRVVGTKPVSLARLRTVDLVERFVRGRGRTRAQDRSES